MAIFSAQLNAFANKTTDNIDLVVRRITLSMFGKVIAKSPVGNPSLWKHPRKGYVGGRFKGNWQPAIGSIPSGVLPDIDASGATTNAKVQTKVATVKAGDIIYLINNLPYARRLEYGHSRQAAAGMVRLTVTEFSSVVRKTASELPK